MKNFILFMIIYASVFNITSAGAVDQETKRQELTFGVVPQQAASKLARLWTPILEYLSDRCGYKLQFKTAPNIPSFEKRVAAGEYDIAYMNPYHYTVFHRSLGYQAIAKQKDKNIQGIIVVRQESPLHNLSELTGKTLAFPAPAAFAASILPRAYLKKNGITITPKYVSSHDSVYMTIAKKLYPAGGGIMRTFNNMNSTTRDQLRILWTSQPYTPHAIATHPRIPMKVIQKMTQAMQNMQNDPQGQKLLQNINFTGIELAQDADWDDIRGLQIELLNVPNETP